MWAPEQRSTHQSALERAERAPESVEPVRAPPPNHFSQPLAPLKERASPPTGHRRNHPDGRRRSNEVIGSSPGLPPGEGCANHFRK